MRALPQQCVSSAVCRARLGPAAVTLAALSLAGSTAMHMLTDRTDVHQDDWALIIGGASGVGSAAIQIAKHLGAYVISLSVMADRVTISRQRPV